MRIVHNGGATVLNHEGVEYQADEAGVFDVPTDLGEALVHFPDWDQEYVAIDRAEEQRIAAEREPDAQTARIVALEERVQRLEDLVRATTGPVPAAKGRRGAKAAETPPPPGISEPPAGTPLTADELADVAAREAVPEATPTPQTSEATATTPTA